MQKTVTLRNNHKVKIRHMQPEDTQRSFEFFSSLPEDDRKYLRVDVARWEVVERRINEAAQGRVERLVVLDGEKIVADGALELIGHGWGENIAEIRLIVARSHQRLGVGTLLARELHFLAAEHKVDRIVARLMRPQVGAHRIMQRLGFHEEFLIPEQVKDQNGEWQDMIIMRCNLDDLWQEMESLLEQSDWKPHV